VQDNRGSLTGMGAYNILCGITQALAGTQHRKSQPCGRLESEVCVFATGEQPKRLSYSVRTFTLRRAMKQIPPFRSLARPLPQILIIASLAFFGGCRKQVCDPPPKDDVAYAMPSPSANAPTVDVYFDSTLSMKGFVASGTTSNFQQAIPILESAVISRWAGGGTQFFKFGTKIEALPGRSYLDAVKPQFYEDRDYNTLTLIENVVDSAKPDHLTVIVTDLFQNNSDVNQLSEKIKKKYVAQALAVGVLGLRSEFEGPVYDVGPDKYSFEHHSGSDQKKFRPFYLLVLGSHADIAKYFDALAYGGFNKFPSELQQRVIFSPFVASPLANFESAPILKATKIARQDSGTLVRNASKDPRIEEFKIVGSTDVASFTTELRYYPLPYVVSTSDSLDPEVTSWKCGDKSGMQETAEGKNALTIIAKTALNENPIIHLDAKIDPKLLPSDGIYAFRVVLRPHEYSLPAWIADWNMKAELIDYWHNTPSEFDGSKTYNLENFLRTLWGAVLDAHRPKSAVLYIYVKRGSS